MEVKIGDFVIQDRDPDKGFLYVDYENAMGGKLLRYLDYLYTSLRSGELSILITPGFVTKNGEIVPSLTPFVRMCFQGYRKRIQVQRLVVVVGGQGVGKSVLAIKAGANIYALNDMNENLPVEERFINYIITLYHIGIDPIELNNFIEFLKEHGLRSPYYIIDDAQLLFSTNVYFTNRDLYVHTSNLLTLIRSNIMTLVMTLPTDIAVLNSTIKRMEGIILTKVNDIDRFTGIALGVSSYDYSRYRMYTKTSRNRFVSYYVEYNELDANGNVVPYKSREGIFSKYLPDNIYNIYNTIRENYITLIQSLSRKRINVDKSREGGDGESFIDDKE
ncbi:DnaA-like replication initiation protein [Acidianus tailed spindle virus]|uniref:DnaA-like replication initiation protein n=1 Tax=Acidianus tailed spindle virus TaxID=1797140 RepID=UPI00076F3185|nr:DnaA-like replication initiation protein [Acidianus tailed spindle virus]AME30064.1 ATPase domain protein [Acidianus tailed spindle virus]